MGRIALVLRNIIDIVFPIECLGCKKEGEWICEECAQKIPINSEPYCLGCKRKTRVGEFCEECKNNYSLNGIFIASDYDNKIIKKAIKTLKYRFVHNISQELAKLLFLFFSRQPDWIKNKSWIIIPVPLHKKRLKWRGFNQAEKLSQEFIKHSKLEMDVKNLQRIVHTKSQAKLNEVMRKKNILNSLSWQGGSLSGKNIIVVDDVTTTGSTLEECAKVLKKAGAETVWGLVVAKG